ncbi:MAG: ABC transporter ATP-binding protein [Clostridia bacterium]|nr:ABC transporter ATP-binding protein [Clostridia bacterium]
MENILSADKIVKFYKTNPALKYMSMNVPKGAIYGLVGKNGAGKTTLIRIVSGLQEPSKGQYTLFGINSDNSRAIRKIRKNMGVMVDSPAVDLDLTARENLMVQYKIIGISDYDTIDGLLKSVGLDAKSKKKVKTFSLGMRQRLGIAMALAGEPEFVILDEPANGIDPQGIIQLRELILRLNREKHTTFLISSHILDELSRVATHYGFVDDGRMVKEITAEELNSYNKKCTRYKLSDIETFERAAKKLELDYKVVSENQADVFGDVKIVDVAVALDKENCNIISATEHNESLEAYYVNLVGGERDA